MHFNINTLALLALLFGTGTALPSDSSLQSIERDLSQVVKRGLPYKCNANDAQCNQAKATLQAREARGCDVWKCIVEGSAATGACIAAVDEGGINPLADIACVAAMQTYINDCDHCLGTCRIEIRNSSNSEVGSVCVDAGSSGSVKNTQTGQTITFTTSIFCGVTATGGLGANDSLAKSGTC